MINTQAASLLTVIFLAGCVNNVHTLENTQSMSREELASLCEDLSMRAEQDCRWNMQQQQSSIPDQQTWEVNCRARRNSARQSFENVCLDVPADEN